MDRRTRTLFIGALVVLVVAAGGAAVFLSGQGERGPTDLSVTGVVAGVRSEGIDRVRSFTIRTNEGQIVEFEMGALEDPAVFPPGHLAEHQATADPVKVWYVRRGETNVAVRLDDVE